MKARTSIESVLALEAQCMAVVADTDAEPVWRAIMDQARVLSRAISWGESSQAASLIASLRETLKQTSAGPRKNDRRAL